MGLSVTFQPQFDFFLRRQHRHQFSYTLNRKASVKDIIESFGVPHTEVGHIFYNEIEIDFACIPDLTGSIHVHPITEPFDVLSSSFLRPHPMTQIKFVSDVNVIRLGRLLRLSGFDVKYTPDYSDKEIADIAQEEKRIVLTRDTALLKRKKIDFAKRIRADMPYDQLVETIRFFGLRNLMSFFSRCTACNAVLVKVKKEDILHLLEPKTKQYFDTFFQCPHCKNVFWRGSHYDNIKKRFAALGIFAGQ